MRGDKKSKILTAARSVFLRYGYKRVNMGDLAEAAGMSRPALYVLFKNKEEIFAGVFLQWIDETVAEVEAAVDAAATTIEKLESAFEIWAVRPFELTMASPEAQELIDCSFGFAQASVKHGYAKFETAITPVLVPFAAGLPVQDRMAPERIAHVLASAVRGFKLTAVTPAELRALIGALLRLCIAHERKERLGGMKLGRAGAYAG